MLRDEGMLNFDEPFTNLLCQGMVLDEHGDVMSKSKGNVISPEDMIAAYGADAVRCYILFMAPPDKELLWNEDGSPTPRTGKILAATPMGRFGRPEELIGAVLFLLDDKAASFVTGVVLPIDGGFSAYSGV